MCLGVLLIQGSNGNSLTRSLPVRVGWGKEAVLNINVNDRDLNQSLTTSVPRKKRQRPSTATSEVK
jgi:hypothetical protein